MTASGALTSLCFSLLQGAAEEAGQAATSGRERG
jgi:hypothetical protein